MQRPGRPLPTELAGLTSTLAVVGNAKVETIWRQPMLCRSCARVVVDADELLFSEIAPASEFARGFAFHVETDELPRETARGIWLWSFGSWQRLGLEEREVVIRSRTRTTFRYGFPPNLTIALDDGRIVESAFGGWPPELVVVVSTATQAEKESLSGIRSQFRPGRHLFDSCPSGQCSHRRVQHVWLSGNGTTANGLSTAADDWVWRVRQRLELHWDIQRAAGVIECTVRRVTPGWNGEPKYLVTADRILSRKGVRLSAGEDGWISARRRVGSARIGERVIALLDGDLEHTREPHPTTASRLLPPGEWPNVHRAIAELVAHGVMVPLPH